jgi:benzoyl-CoA-dihydrodiol lyase
MNAVLEAQYPAECGDEMVTFQRHPSQYRHWKLRLDGDVARLVLDVAEDGGIRPGYRLKLNSYDLGVDIELRDALDRIRFEQPQVKVVVIESAKERIWCSGANIYMLGLSSHAWKVNFCKFTNETRNGMEDSSRHDGLKFLAAVTGACAGGGYELALACDRIVMIDDRSSTVSLPEVPLLGVLPGTGGLTRLTDKRHVRRDLADVFCTTSEGVRADRAKQWNLIDDHARPQDFAAAVQRHIDALKAQSTRHGTQGIDWAPLNAQYGEDTYRYDTLQVAIDRARRVATITLRAPADAVPDDPAAQRAQGAVFWPLKFARELDDAILMLRTNELEVGTWVLQAEGDAQAVLQAEAALLAAAGQGAWFAHAVLGALRRTYARLDVTSRSLFAFAGRGSCFAGLFMEAALACDRIYLLDDQEQPERAPSLTVSAISTGKLPTVAGTTRLAHWFCGREDACNAVYARLGEPLAAARAAELGLATQTPDDIDWDDEIRLLLEERAALSPDALTGMEASLRFGVPETMATRIFGRLSAWQNWIFNRPNAVGDEGALKLFGTGRKARFDWKRV